ncbi:MAG: methyltransferase domain-containing protein [Planctomycetaceae bacterium]
MTAPIPFICPTCGNEMSDERVAGFLWCQRCALCINFRDGIPRFVESAHLESFGLQWNRYEVAHADEDRATFQAKTGFSLTELAGKNVLDAGCGGGRYSRIAGEAGANIIGADHTTAVDKAAKLCRGLANVSFVQADLKKLPFPSASFDYAFSIGVMHHDVATKPVFDAVARMVKPGGKLSVWLYRKNQFWQEWLNSAIRRRTMNMPPEKLERWCRFGAWLGGIPLIKQTLNKIVNFSNHPNWENRVCDTFDWYAPQYQYHHTVDELCGWFREAGYDRLVVLPPEKTGRFYRWTYERNLLIGSGVNVQGTRNE